MEPEKIDALFRQKMENFQKTPSADAWAKLQSRIEPPKKEEKKVMWLYYVAASVMLVLVSGVLWLANHHENGTGTHVATTTKTEIQKPAEKKFELNVAEKEAQFPTNQKGEQTEASAEKAGEGNPNKDLLQQQNNQPQQLAAVKAKPAARQKNQAENSISEKATAPASAPAANKPNQPVNRTNTETALAVNMPPVKPAPKPEAETVKKEALEILIIKDMAEPEAMALHTEPAKPEAEAEGLSRIQLVKNIGKQLLNLKRGEKIDRTELGLPENYSIAFETKIVGQKISKSINL